MIDKIWNMNTVNFGRLGSHSIPLSISSKGPTKWIHPGDEWENHWEVDFVNIGSYLCLLPSSFLLSFLCFVLSSFPSLVLSFCLSGCLYFSCACVLSPFFPSLFLIYSFYSSSFFLPFLSLRVLIILCLLWKPWHSVEVVLRKIGKESKGWMPLGTREVSGMSLTSLQYHPTIALFRIWGSWHTSFQNCLGVVFDKRSS